MRHLTREGRQDTAAQSSWIGTMALVLVGSGLGGCATTAKQPAARFPAGGPARELQLEPIRLSVGQGGQIQAVDALGRFEAGGRFLAAKQYDRALQQYDALIVEFPQSRLVSPALYNAGLAHEGLGRFGRAAARYQELVRRFGHTRDAIDAAFRLGGCLAEARQWQQSADVFGRLAKRSDLSSADRVEAYARQGLAYYRLDNHARAGRSIRQGIQFLKQIDHLERLDSDFFAAMLYYYFAAIPHARFRDVQLGPQAKLAHQMDEKARLLLAAQGRYIEAIRVKNPYWATVSGFQIGSLYRELYDALMTALPDFEATARKNAQLANTTVKEAEKQLIHVYLEHLHRRIVPLLKKAMRVFERNVVVARRIGVDGTWIDKSRRQIRDLKRLITAAPREVMDLLPERPVAPEDQPGDPSPEIPDLDVGSKLQPAFM